MEIKNYDNYVNFMGKYYYIGNVVLVDYFMDIIWKTLKIIAVTDENEKLVFEKEVSSDIVNGVDEMMYGLYKEIKQKRGL